MAVTLYNPETFADDLQRVIHASRLARVTRACLLTTRDRDHGLNMLKKVASEGNRPLYHFTVAGRRRYNPAHLTWEIVGSDTSDTLSLLRHAHEIRGGGVVVFEDCAAFLRDDGGDQRVRMMLAEMLSAETATEWLVLVFLEPPEAAGRLPSILANRFIRLDVPYPRAHELIDIAREEIAVVTHHTQTPINVEEICREAERLSTGLTGLTVSAARDALRDALAPDPENFDAALTHLQRRKALALHRELAMNVLNTEDIEEPIGLDNLVGHLAIIRNKMGVTGRGRARGILLVGPPGTGKTMLARSIGRLVGLPVVEFKIASLMSSLLGETEHRFSQAFATLEAMSPNVVFIDEIEKAFGDSSERDGGTMMRCTGALLSWLSDNPYPNFIVATSNSLQRMGEIGQTMTRSERFDTCFFVDVPSFASRQRILDRELTGVMSDTATVARALAEMTEKFSGADLCSLVKQGISVAEHQRVPLSMDMLKAQVERKRMRAVALYDEFQELRRWGRRYCDPAGPWDA